MIGAPVFAATAALRLGSGLVQIAVPRTNLPFALMITPELVGLGLDDHDINEPQLSEAATKADAIVLGPGLGQSDIARARFHLLIRLDKPMVLDADALNLIAAAGHWPTDFKARAVLTPHPGEMARLAKLIGHNSVPADDEGRIDLATQAARSFAQTIVLKGHHTVVTDGERLYLNDTGDSTLSKAGTGDLLSGMIGCLLAQHMDSFDAACLATHLHGLAGELTGHRFGRRCALARDILDSLPETVRVFEGRSG